MAAASDAATLISSLSLRLSIWIFLRWIPTSIVPPLGLALTAVYIPAFFQSFRATSQYKLLSDEFDIIVKDTVASSDSTTPESEVELLEGAEDGPLQELDVQTTLTYEEREPRVLRTLLTGLPSPSSVFWSWVTFSINMVLIVMALDLVYRAPLFYQCHDASFGRLGFVSHDSASILVREPFAYDVKLHYRPVDDSRWKHSILPASQPKHWLTNDTDFTAVIKVESLRSDTPYEYVIETSSGNVTGTFSTAPRPGQLSPAKDDKYTFVHSSCIKPRVPYSPLQHPLEFPGMAHLAHWLPELRPYFMLFLGDFIYVDVPWRLGKDVESYRREYRQVYSSPSWPSVSNNLPWIHVIDDHEIQNDWSGNTTGVYSAAYDAFTNYHAQANPPAHRQGHTYFSFTQGPAEFFLVDTRRYRSPENSNADDHSKTMLGAQQLSDLLAWISAPPPPGVHWKIIVTGVPFTKNWRFGFEDTWGGYLPERRKILETAWTLSATHSVGVVILSGDRHEFAATSFPPPAGSQWPISATVHEFSTSPLSMFYLPKRTYNEIDDDDVCIKYLPDGNSKFGAVEITSPKYSEQSLLNYRLFIDGKEAWTHIIGTPSVKHGSQRARDAVWG